MGKRFSEELNWVANTLAWAAALPLALDVLEVASSDLPLVAVGSGGSFTAAEFAARMASHGRSRAASAMTPLEYAHRAAHLGPHAAWLLSAEGKNGDVRLAAAAAMANAQQVLAVTFKPDSLLAEKLAGQHRARVIGATAPWDKDGYLATNSLLATITLVARLHEAAPDWSRACSRFAAERHTAVMPGVLAALSGGARLLVLHGLLGTPCAIDLESKFAESAIGTVQVADLRQFAHGRHVQLTSGGEQFAVVAFVSPDDLNLWATVRSLLPESIPVQSVVLPGAPADAALQGLLATFAFVEVVSAQRGIDPGMPDVPEFARRIHAIEPAALIQQPDFGRLVNGKVGNLNRKGLSPSALQAAGDAYIDRLAEARLHGLVVDFDGTCCETANRLDGIDREVTVELQRLLNAGMAVGFASGRGDSLHKELRQRLQPASWHKVTLGCHSGSTVVTLDQPWQTGVLDPGLRVVADRLAQVGVGRDSGYVVRAHSGQLTVEAKEPRLVHEAFLRACELVRSLEGWRVFRSSHSIDLLCAQADKSNVVGLVARALGVSPDTQILRIGDRGETYGNDSELLCAGLSLSVDGTSIDPQACWLFESHLSTATQRTAAYLAAVVALPEGGCRISPAVLARWRVEVRDSIDRLDSGPV
jgi:hypothetical protein